MRILLPYEIKKNASNKFLDYFYDSLKEEGLDIIDSGYGYGSMAQGIENE